MSLLVMLTKLFLQARASQTRSKGALSHTCCSAAVTVRCINTWLLIQLTPEGVVFSSLFLFFSVLRHDLSCAYLVDHELVSML